MTLRRPLQTDLEPLLAESGLSGAAIEILLHLALGPARAEDLERNAMLLPDEDMAAELVGLLDRGLIESGGGRDGRFQLTARDDLCVKLPGVAGRRLALLAGQALRDHVHGTTCNPGLPESGSGFRPQFTELRRWFTGRLPQVEVKVQSLCNIGCIYCFLHKDPEDTLDTPGALAGIGKAASGGTRRLILSGGEPTMRQDLPDLIRHARELGFVEVQLFTNGLMFAYADFLRACVRAGLTSVVLHASASNPLLYRRLTGRDRFRALESAMHNLSAYPQLEMAALTVVNRLNLEHLDDCVGFFRDWQERSRFSHFATELPLCCVHSRTWAYRDRVLPLMEEVLPVVDSVLQRHCEEPWPILFYNIPYCLLPGRETHSFDLYLSLARQLLPDGEFDHTLLDALFVKPFRCQKCRHEPYCPGLSRGYARLYGTGMLSPVAHQDPEETG